MSLYSSTHSWSLHYLGASLKDFKVQEQYRVFVGEKVGVL